MVAEVLRYLSVQPGGRFVDCTVGGGGHSLAILEAAAPGGLLLGIDADAEALEIARARLQPHTDSALLSQANFRDLAAVCRKANFIPVHGVLFDLGVSSYQLSAEGRGFSFQAEAPLDMRFGESQTVTADEIVNTYSERDLADLIWRYGEEPASRRIARAIVTRPKLLIADEPTGNLDPDLSLEVMRIFRRFNEVGVTLLIASHDISLIDRLGCRRIALEDGRLQQDIDPWQ